MSDFFEVIGMAVFGLVAAIALGLAACLVLAWAVDELRLLRLRRSERREAKKHG